MDDYRKSPFEPYSSSGSVGKFSTTEIQHLTIAYIVLVISFSIAFSTSLGGILFGYFSLDWFLYVALPVSFIAVGFGFVLHEMAHKFTAQHYGCWSEFRYYERGLMFALLFSVLIGVVFAAPGATMVSGRVSKRQNGIMSLAGPVTNMIIACALIPFTFMFSLYSILWYYVTYAGFIIAFLGFFNLLPIYPLDGSKVWDWNGGIYIGALAISVIILGYYWISL
jgi:Zn-dependent protease